MSLAGSLRMIPSQTPLTTTPAAPPTTGATPTTTASSTTTATPTSVPGSQIVPTLPADQIVGVLAITAAAILIAGGLIIFARYLLAKQAPGSGVVRSWMAMSLVVALVLFCAVAMGIGDGNLRSTLIGGLTASVGSAVTFYFSTKSSDQARQDVMQASGTLETVPDLTGKTEEEAAALLGRTQFKLQAVRTTPPAPADSVVKTQTPEPGAKSPGGATVMVTMGK